MPGHFGRTRLLSLRIQIDAGTYYIGDPGYAVADEKWDGFLKAMTTHVVDGWGAVVLFTPLGDGLYLDQHDNPYTVNSGLIGVFPVEHVSRSRNREEMARLGQFHHFESSFLIEYDGDLEKVWFGAIEIELGQTYTEV